MLPTILAKQLQKGIGDYIETTFPMTNEPFRGSVQKMLETKDSVYHEPFVSVRLPFRVAEKMPDCFEAIHPAYLPYVHQQNAFDRLVGNDGRSTLITTGTGSGKTECFLYPILEYYGFMQAMITLMKGNYHQVANLIEELKVNYPRLNEIDDPETAVNALLALISYARTGSPDNLRPFLNVQVQLWMRELRRLVAKVSGKEITYSIANDLNSQKLT